MAAKTKALRPIHLLVSTEPLLVTRELSRIRDAAVPETARAFNYDVLDAKSVGAAGILGAVRTVPMMAERRLIEVRGLETLPAAELNKLVPYLQKPIPESVLVAVCKKADRRLKFFAAAKKAGWLEDLKPPRQLSSWLAAEAKMRGTRASSDALRRLVDVVGPDLARLAGSLDQLALYAGDRAISRDDVDELIAETRERTVFELTDAIGAGDTNRAFTALGSLFEQRQSAIGVVILLARHMRQLAWILEGQRQRWPKAELVKRVGAPPFVVDKLLSQARRLTGPSVSRAVVRLGEVDQRLKGRGQLSKALGRELSERVELSRVVATLLA